MNFFNGFYVTFFVGGPNRISIFYTCGRTSALYNKINVLGSICMKFLFIIPSIGPLLYASLIFLPCDAMHSAAIASTRCLSVYPSVRLPVTFASCAKTNKGIFENFSPSGSQAILVFPHQTGWRYCDGNLPNGGVECKGV